MCAATHSLAQGVINPFELSLEELLRLTVVTAAAGYEQKLNNIPVTATHVSRPQWQASGATTIEDILIAVPGVHIGIETLAVASPVPSIRGLSGDFGRSIKMLVDGVPLEDIGLGGRPFYEYPMIGNLQGIEVVKGPGSVVYGADAFAGVINLVVPDPGDSSNNQITVRTGEDKHRDFMFAHGGEGKAGLTQDMAWYVAAEYSESGTQSGRVVDTDLQSFFDGIFGTAASFAPSVLSDQHTLSNIHIKLKKGGLSLDHFGLKGKGSARTGAANSLDQRGYLTASNYSTRLTTDLNSWDQALIGDFDLSATYTLQTETSRWDVFPPNSLFPVGDDGNLFSPGGGLVFFPDGVRGSPGHRAKRYDVRLTHQFTGGTQHKIRWQIGAEKVSYRVVEKKNFGAGVLNGITYPSDGSPYISEGLIDVTGTPDAYQPSASRQFWWLSFQDEWAVSNTVSISLGVRYDHYSDFGGTSNPRLGLNWSPREELGFRLFYGTAFRAPKFTEQNNRNNPSTQGNRDLKPETIDTVEAGFRYQITENLTLDSAVYHYETEDLINAQVVPGSGDPTRIFQNTIGTRGKGFEFDLHWKTLDNLSLNFNYAYNDVKSSNGDIVPGTPSDLAYLGFHWRFGNSISWLAGIKYVGGRDRLDEDPRAPLENYTLATSNLSWTLHEQWSVSWIINNLGDEDAREYMPPDANFINDLPLNGRQQKLELKYFF